MLEGEQFVYMRLIPFKDRIIMGAERKTHYIEPKDKKCTAYHEVELSAELLFDYSYNCTFRVDMLWWHCTRKEPCRYTK